MIRVLLFATLKDIVGQASLELEPGGDVDELFGRLCREHPQLKPYRQVALVAVNQEYSSWDRPLREGDEVAFFPPVSGGRGW